MCWLIASKLNKDAIIYSPDNDLIPIGLPICQNLPDRDFIVWYEYSKLKVQGGYCNVSQLLREIKNTTNFQNIDPEKLARIFLFLYATTGCDYVSYFRWLTKKIFLDIFYQNTDFICKTIVYQDQNCPRLGCLSDHEDDENMHLSFLRLIGCAYFGTRKSSYEDDQIFSAQQLYEKLYSPNEDQLTNHHKWLDDIRKGLFDTVDNEEKFLPSNDALHLHFLRSLYAFKIWYQSSKPTISFPSLTDYGWEIIEIPSANENQNETMNENGEENDESTTKILQIKWDSPENLDRIERRIDFYTKGCECRKAKCDNSTCSCVKKGRKCGPVCKFCMKNPENCCNKVEDLTSNYY